MSNTAKSPFELFQLEFSQLGDPRNQSQTTYPLSEIIFLVLASVISDCNSWDEIEDFGEDQLDWLRTYYPYESGIPRHDTLNRVLSMIDPQVLSAHFSRWIGAWVDLPPETLINLDGKTLRGSKGSNGSKAIHVVNAFVNELQLVLAQVATADKSNEITAIPELLNLLNIKGCIITIDAMGTQKAIAKQIVEAEADYILALKNNHPELYQSVEQSFERLEPLDSFEQVEKNKSRLETRKLELLGDFSWIEPELLEPWKGLKRVARVFRRRESLINGKVETQTSYYLVSCEQSAQFIAQAIRGHWGIENRLHWRLDVLFGEDKDRKRAAAAAANFSTFRKMVQNLLLKSKTKKASVPRKRKMAARNQSFRNQIIQGL